MTRTEYPVQERIARMPESPQVVPKGMRTTIICMRVIAGAYIGLGIGVGLLVHISGQYTDVFPPEMFWLLAVLGSILAVQCLLMAVCVEIIIRDLNRLKYWAWLVALITLITHIPTPLILPGILGTVGLVNPEVKAAIEKRHSSNGA
jgi:hypothetical protein